RGAALVAEEILEAIRSLRMEHKAHPLGHVTASAGIAVGKPSEHEVSPATLIESADKLLYAAKQKGRDRYCIGEEVLGA
ncbi:diguanylate cyclase, partial [Pseudomonas sp. 51_B]